MAVWFFNVIAHVNHQRNLADSEDFVWICKSPNATNNATHLPEGDCAAAMRWRYRASGSSTSDFEAKYSLEVKVWSAQWPHGKVVCQRKEATKLCCLQPHFLLAPKDLGVWLIHIYRNGSEVGLQGIAVDETPRADQDGISRRYDNQFTPLDEGSAYTNDDALAWSYDECVGST